VQHLNEHIMASSEISRRDVATTLALAPFHLVVENMPGAGGISAARAALSAGNDG
jgi:hypothetical protein